MMFGSGIFCRKEINFIKQILKPEKGTDTLIQRVFITNHSNYASTRKISDIKILPPRLFHKKINFPKQFLFTNLQLFLHLWEASDTDDVAG